MHHAWLLFTEVLKFPSSFWLLRGFVCAAAAFQMWLYCLMLTSPPISSTAVNGFVLNLAEQISVVLYSILMPIVMLVFIGFVLTIIHKFLVQEWIFAYFGKHLEIVEAVKNMAAEQWYVRRHKGRDDSSLVAMLRYIANSDAHTHELTGMEQIEANMQHTEDLTLDDIREVLRLMQQEGMFDKQEPCSSPPSGGTSSSCRILCFRACICLHLYNPAIIIMSCLCCEPNHG